MAFEVLKDLETWLNRKVHTDCLSQTDREELRAILNTTPAGDMDVVLNWLEAQPAPSAGSKDVEGAHRHLRNCYAQAQVCELKDDASGATKHYLEVVRSLGELDGQWGDIREISLHALSVNPDHRFPHWLLKAWSHLPDSPDKQRDVETALQWCPEDPELLWHEGRRTDAEGHSEDAARLAVRAFRGFAALKELDQAEEALCRALESECPEISAAVIEVLPVLARHKATDLLKTAVDFLLPLVEQFDLNTQLATALETILKASSEFGFLRQLFVGAELRRLGAGNEFNDLVRRSGLGDPSQPFATALIRFHEFCQFRPGAVVEHHSWGLGRVVSNDGDSVIIDFEDRSGHRMGFDMAQSSLSSLPQHALRAVRFIEPERLLAERTADPVGLVVRVLEELGGEAATKDIKGQLSGEVVPDAEWTSWWSKTKKLLEADGRIDHSQAFQQVYRLATEETMGQVALPPIVPKKSVKKAVSVVRKFLNQHGDKTAAAIAEYGEILSRCAKEGGGDESLGALPLLLEWFPDRRDEWIELSAMGYDTGGKTTGVSASEEQQALLEIGLEGAAWEIAALTALTSRYPTVRQQAMACLVDQWGFDAEKRESDPWDAAVLSASRRYPQLQKECLSLIELTVQGAVGPHLDMPWALLATIAEILATRSAKEHTATLSSLLDEKGQLASALKDHVCTPETLRELRSCLLSGHVRGSDLAIVAGLLRSVGQTELAEELADHLDIPEEDMGVEGAPYLKPGVSLMTRATQLLQQEELKRLEKELRVDLPQAIKKARELGDLSENAEYHDARERQGIVNSQFLALRELLAHVQCIEDIEAPEDIVAVGTEVHLKDLTNGTESTVWLLGIGDGHHGHDVISYDAPLGKALLGAKVGDSITLDHGSSGRTLEVLAVRRRLPED